MKLYNHPYKDLTYLLLDLFQWLLLRFSWYPFEFLFCNSVTDVSECYWFGFIDLAELLLFNSLHGRHHEVFLSIQTKPNQTNPYTSQVSCILGTYDQLWSMKWEWKSHFGLPKWVTSRLRQYKAPAWFFLSLLLLKQVWTPSTEVAKSGLMNHTTWQRVTQNFNRLHEREINCCCVQPLMFQD